MKKRQLFCIPCAGGSASFYYEFARLLKGEIDVYPIELKGHGARIEECLCNSMNDLVNDVTESVVKFGIKDNYEMLGYSMGTNICFEVQKKLSERFGIEPNHMYFCANNAPHIDENEPWIHNLDDADFIKEISRFGGIPDEILREPELLNLFLPIMRADFKIENEYIGVERRLPCDISIIYGAQDNDITRIGEWKRYTKSRCLFYEMSGDHFFIRKNTELIKLVKIIRES